MVWCFWHCSAIPVQGQPQTTRFACCHSGWIRPPILNDHPQWIPIPPLTFEWESNGRRLSWWQFPLQLRYAMTIHKSLGQTLDKAVIDINKQELAAGCTFVALSRLRNLDHALLQPMSYQKLHAISTGNRFAEWLQEESRFKLLASIVAPDSVHDWMYISFACSLTHSPHSCSCICISLLYVFLL